VQADGSAFRRSGHGHDSLPSDSEKYPVHFDLVFAGAGMQAAEGVFFDYHLRENVVMPTPEGGRSFASQRLVFSLNGLGIADAAPRAMASATAKALRGERIQPEEVQFLVPHQAGTGYRASHGNEAGGDRHSRGSD